MLSKLEQLRAMTTVVADTGDMDSIRAFKPGVAHGAVLVVIVVAVGVLRLPMVPVVAIVAPVSVAIAFYEQKRQRPSAAAAATEEGSDAAP